MTKYIKLSDLPLKIQAAIKKEVAFQEYSSQPQKSFKSKSFKSRTLKTKASLSDSAVNAKIEKYIKAGIEENYKDVESSLDDQDLSFNTIGYSKVALLEQKQVLSKLPEYNKPLFEFLKSKSIEIVDVDYKFENYGEALGSEYDAGGKQHGDNEAIIDLKLNRLITEEETKYLKETFLKKGIIEKPSTIGSTCLDFSWYEVVTSDKIRGILTINGMKWSDPTHDDETDDEDYEDYED
jgi:hypothetical protein